ncbi:MAG: hypothetical protein JXQ29_14320 [Planctomycetes bacterium]|nr:hypothetical protein [Planctomycetota bacterium]
MNCARVRALLDDLHDRRLREEERCRVSDHLGACVECAARYGRMKRVLEAVRQLPRPRAPVLELPVAPPGVALFRSEPLPRRRLWLQRAAAAVLLLAALGATHRVAFWLGEQRNQDLAEIARQELPRLVSEHLDETDTHLGFARQVAQEEPQSVERLVFGDSLGRGLRARSAMLARLAEQPALQPVRASLERFVRAQEELYGTSGTQDVHRGLARVERELADLRAQLARLWAGSSGGADVADDPEAVAREGVRLLVREGRPDEAMRLVTRYVRGRDVPRFRRTMIYIVGAAARRLGEIPEAEAVVPLLRREGEDGVKVFFGAYGIPLGEGSRVLLQPGFRAGALRVRCSGPRDLRRPQQQSPFGPAADWLFPLGGVVDMEIWDLLRATQEMAIRGGRVGRRD